MAETAFAVIKRRFGPAVYPRARGRQFRGLVVTAAVYTLEQALKQWSHAVIGFNTVNLTETGRW